MTISISCFYRCHGGGGGDGDGDGGDGGGGGGGPDVVVHLAWWRVASTPEL